MRILVGSYHFSPDIGGIETASALLATEFAGKGHDVRLVTETARLDAEPWPFAVIRRPSPARLLKELWWCDLFYQNNISLQTLWAAFLVSKPWVVTHQTWISGVDGTMGWQDPLKRLLLHFGSNVAVSQAIAEKIPVPSVIVGNPYRADLFKPLSGRPRDRELVFLGRLVSDKGLDLLIEALGGLRREGLAPRLTVIGNGPEEAAMRNLATARGVAEQIDFAGQRTGPELAELLNAHQIMVAPSRWPEPFGIVALEGIGCGCVVVGSEGGGLREAIGTCGLTFPNGSVEGLKDALRRLLLEPALVERLRLNRTLHLERFEVGAIARKYLDLFEEVTQ
jgi:glycosyltransferase involved in cell wall biosynthesis